ncbi:MAG: hypothetical protein CMM87_00365 [Rickettsiales bacterium]|nr:hypothetical protein [Rickettsiales bacterium]|tara:strand:- start:1815 stop:5243 length:3429 start_codon:yes stop_codon:yes gene_type:complete
MIQFNVKQFLTAVVMIVAGMKVLADTTGSVATAPAPANPAPVLKSAPVSAAALPTGATVTTGTAAITTSGQHMTITPHQPKTWINWQSYNVAAGHSVTYNQSAGALTVNQVVGQNMSTIAGQINVTGGTAVLINENGLVFKDGAKIDGNMVFSTQPLRHSSFMAGDTLRFEPSLKMGSIEQSGTFSGCGLTAFVGPRAAFNGDVHAALQVYAGDRVSMHFNGDKLMGVDITEQAKAHNIEVNNVTGSHIKITAAMAEQAVEGIINVKGHVQATDMDVDNGTITLNGGDVTLAKTAKLTTQGGTIRIGVPESYNSVNPAQRALVNTLLIQPGAELDAGAGNMFLLAQQYAEYHGSYTTQGGLIELSSRKDALYRHSAYLNGGTLALDPETLTIVWEDAGVNEVSAQTINTQLQTGSVFLQADTSITLKDLGAGHTINWSTDHALSLKAEQITLNGNITYNGGLGSFGRLNLYTTTANQAVTGTGTLTFNGGSIRTMNVDPDVGLDRGVDRLTVDGTGLVDAYQVITTSADLKGIAMGSNYALGNDIDIDGEANWTPLGTNDDPFTGKLTGDNFQGGAYEIQNLKITSNGDNKGLFGRTNGATIDHLRLHIAAYSGDGNNRGGLVGQTSGGTFYNVGVTGGFGVSVTGEGNIGGLIGSFISNSSTLNITNCFSTVNVHAIDNIVGGLVGVLATTSANSTATITRSYATGNVTSNQELSSKVGGLVGLIHAENGNTQINISESFATGSISNVDRLIGGLIGNVVARNFGQITIENSFALGSVSSNSTAGGLIGDVFAEGVAAQPAGITINNNYSAANVTTNMGTVGGSIGILGTSDNSSITVEDVYSSGTVTRAGTEHNQNIGIIAAGGDPVDPPTITTTYNVDTDTPGRITTASLFNNTEGSVPAAFVREGSPWAIREGEDAGRVIMHLPRTAIAVVPAVNNVIASVVADGQPVSFTTLNLNPNLSIRHYFVPPFYYERQVVPYLEVTGSSLSQSEERKLEILNATTSQVIDFYVPPTSAPTITTSDNDQDVINISDLDVEEDAVVDITAETGQSSEIAAIDAAIDGLGDSIDNANEDEEAAQGTSASGNNVLVVPATVAGNNPASGFGITTNAGLISGAEARVANDLVIPGQPTLTTTAGLAE